MSLTNFVAGYTEAALFSSNDDSDESGGEPLDKNYGPGDVDEATRRQMRMDCGRFYNAENESAWGVDDTQQGLDDTQAGRDFWFTRNGHGVGFWDRDELTAENQKRLSAAAKKFGTFDLYVGDDGKIHGSPLTSDAEHGAAMAAKARGTHGLGLHGWRTVNTGGGCSAELLVLSSDRYALVTSDENECTAPSSDDEESLVAIYEGDPEEELGGSSSVDDFYGTAAACRAWAESKRGLGGGAAGGGLGASLKRGLGFWSPKG